MPILPLRSLKSQPLQRTDGSGDVVISFKLTDADNDRCTITVQVSNDGGSTWTITPSPSALSGDLTNVSPSSNLKNITWASKIDLPGEYGTNYRIKVTVADSKTPPAPDIMWVSISNSGFVGEMSRYEITNSQYAQFLNAALATGDLIVSDSSVYGAGLKYYQLDGGGGNWNGATNGGASRIKYSDDQFSVDNGFENHPVTHVSWYGATAFCNYYGLRLPTGSEWLWVATYGFTYTYENYVPNINNNIANYRGSYHPHGTTPVGVWGLYGYGMADMAGNVYEWTTWTIPSGSYAVVGGGWNNTPPFSGYYLVPYGTDLDLGFRVCR